MQLLLPAYVHVDQHHTGVIRSTFMVDEKGKIAVAQYNVKATGHVAKLRRDLSI
jgi:thioredoxin-dependent peroxiredoxin